jgi:L-threonylcarbamoyladenylate synthase
MTSGRPDGKANKPLLRSWPVAGRGAESSEVERIGDHLAGGGLLAYPTETSYGLGAAATEGGVEAVRRLKGREADAPFLVLLPSGGDPVEAPKRWGLALPDAARNAAADLWPGPLTMVLFDREARFPPGIRSASGGVAVRVSSHPFVEALMALWDRPLISTSANRAGSQPTRSAGEIVAAFEGLPMSEELWIVDAGMLTASLPSTLVDFTLRRPRVLREGALTFAELFRRVPELDR